MSGLASAALPAFPGAEGFGATSVGGRGGSVYAVTNLHDDGPGSLRDAVSQPHRTIVFRISGTIELKSRLQVSQPFITIAGQTAPGDGITLRGHELFIKDTHDVIVRFIRSRPGDEAKKEMDAVTIWNSRNVILDHCSMSWSTDSLNDVVKESGNVTVQWCLLAEPLVRSVHAKGSHGYATGWDGRTKGGGSFHHNLIAHAASRAPRIGYYKVGRGLNDCRNNVIYNSGPSYGAETGDLNFVGNYYRPGPNSEKLRRPGELFSLWSGDTRMYVAGNVYEGRDDVAAENTKGLDYRAGTNANGTATTVPSRELCIVEAPLAVPAVATQSALDAYERVLSTAGATMPRRDPVDERVLKDVRDRTGKLIDSQADVGGWPELKSTPAPADSDNDGMPDAWEAAKGLNPSDPSDGARESSPGGYTHLELYLAELASPIDERGK